MKSKIAEVKECHEGENQKLILCRQKKNSDFQVLISLNDYRGFVFSMRVNERKKWIFVKNFQNFIQISMMYRKYIQMALK